MRYHSQNLKKEDRTKELVHWRCWFYFGNDSVINFAISIPSGFWHIDVGLCSGWDDEAIEFSVACPLFAVWLGLKNKWLDRILESITKRKDAKYGNGRTIGLSFHDSALYVKLWEDPVEWRSKDPKWWKFSIDFKNLLFGRSKCVTEILQEGEAKIDMPEGIYDATYKVEKRTWTRPRSLFRTSRESIDFDIPSGIPHEGKGENSWDIGMDGTFGISTEWKGNVHDACKRIAMRCLETRQKYGALSSPDYLKWKDKIK